MRDFLGVAVVVLAVAAPAGGAAGATAPAAAGLAVVALPGATDSAWPLAAELYGEPGARALAVDDAHARVLCGERAPDGAPAELRDLADTVGALHAGNDAPTRVLLAGIARRFSARALVVVAAFPAPAAIPTPGVPPTSARVFLADTGDFDAPTYVPDASSATGPLTWSTAARSLARAFAPALNPAPASTPAPALALHPAHPEKTDKPGPPRPFYESPWFWGALGVAALAGGGSYLLARDTGSSTIHLQMQVPAR